MDVHNSDITYPFVALQPELISCVPLLVFSERPQLLVLRVDVEYALRIVHCFQLADARYNGDGTGRSLRIQTVNKVRKC